MKVSWQLLNEIETRLGESFYLLDLDAFKKNYLEFLGAFKKIYPKTNIAYSYKTNYVPRLCGLVDSMGGYAEVVSQMEYSLALKIGVAPQKIIFNGPYKRSLDVANALLAGSVVNLDSSYEVAMVESLAENFPARQFLVGVRCNFDIGVEGISRFGFDVEGEAFKSAFHILSKLKNCCVVGLHCHFSTARKSITSYERRTRKMLNICTQYFIDSPPRFLDLGGGFFSNMSSELKYQFPYQIPDYREYAEAIACQVAQVYKTETGPELLVEPGTALVADVMRFVARVIDIKKVRSKKFVLVSGSVLNIKPTLNEKNLPLRAIRKNPALESDLFDDEKDIVGYTCMEKDYLYRGYHGPLSIGDYLVFENVGAYTFVLTPPFIQPCPAILAYESNSGLETVKRADSFADVFDAYNF